MHSFYVASHSMVTNNVYTPHTKFEIIFVTLAAITNCGFFGVNLNNRNYIFFINNILVFRIFLINNEKENELK